MSVHRLLSGVIGAALLLAGCATTKGRIQMGDLGHDYAQFSDTDNPLSQTAIEYDQVGKPQYDSFFRSAAVIRASVLVSTAFVDATTKNLKSFARDYASSNATDDHVKEIVGKTRPEDLTPEQLVALTKLQKEQQKLSDEQIKYLGRTGQSALAVAKALNLAVTTAQSLVATGSSLTTSVKTDFAGADAIKAPSVTKSVGNAVDNLNSAIGEMPALVKELTILGEGFAAFATS